MFHEAVQSFAQLKWDNPYDAPKLMELYHYIGEAYMRIPVFQQS